MEIEFRHVRVVLVVDELGDLRTAAAALQVSQNALATQLRRIENALGGPLFERDGDTLRRTRLGTYFTAGARDVLADFEALERRSAELTRAGSARQVRLVAAASGLERLVDCCRELLPDHRITTQDLPVAAIAACVADDQADIGYLVRYHDSGFEQADDVTFAPIVEREPAFVALRADHPLAERDEIDLAELAAADWIMAAAHDRSGRDEAFRRACRDAGFEPAIRHTVAEWAAVRHLMLAGLGIGIVSPRVPVPAGLVYKTVRGNPLHRDDLLCWRAESPLADAAERLRQLMIANYAEDVRGNPLYREWWLRHRGSLDQITQLVA